MDDISGYNSCPEYWFNIATNPILRKIKSVQTLPGTKTARLFDLLEEEEEQI